VLAFSGAAVYDHAHPRWPVRAVFKKRGQMMALISSLKTAAGLRRLLLSLAAVATVVSLGAGTAQAQATRTWVSGVGDDANPCSRTAPCKTFAGAISKTAPGGEINCLDPGGFGGVTITKAITISCEAGTAGVLVSGTPGITVNAGPNDQITLRGLDIDGLGTGTNGINFIAGKALLVDNCVIYEFATNAINAGLGAPGSVAVRNTVITNIGGDGIRVSSSAGGASLSVDNVNISRTNNGIEVAAGAIGTVNRSNIFANASGVLASANGAILNVANTVLASNNFGANASVLGATIGLDNNDLFANNTAVNAVAGSSFNSANNNKFSNNNNNGATPSSFMVVH
jgi:hypothetical protein